MKSSIWGPGIAVALFVLLFQVPSNAGDPESQKKFDLKPLWSLSPDADSSYFLEPWYFHKGDLIGASVDDQGNVFLCDKISERLIKLNSGGGQGFAIGSVGTGPEDHQARGEPLVWAEGRMARSDASSEPKAIVYENDGEFREMVRLQVDGQLSRLFWNGGAAVAVSTQWKFQDSGIQLITSLSLLDKDGALVNKHQVNSWVMAKSDQRDEEDMWYEPYVAVSDDGYTFIQNDLYSSHIDCYDNKLNLVWSIDGGWKPQHRTDQEYAEVDSWGVTGLKYSELNHTIRRMCARDNGELWVQPWNHGGPEGTAIFESFSRKGKRSGTVEVSGIPQNKGDWVLRGSKVLWMSDLDKESGEPADASIVVYDLVPQ